MVTLVNTRDVQLQSAPTRYSVVLPLNSIYPSLEDDSWGTSVPLATVTDGPAGVTVRRSTWVGGGGGIPADIMTNVGFFQIDRARTYKARFWVRAVGANGTFYFDLQQFLANGSDGPTNGGRAPYKPGGMLASAATAWTAVESTWAAADWQSGVTQVKPDFLMNYTGTAGYWEVQDFKLTDVTDIVASAAAAAAAQTDATAALSQLATIASDSILSKGEKPVVLKDWTTIAAERADIVAKALAVSVSSSGYTTAYNALDAYLTSLNSPWWADMTVDTPIVPATFQAKFTDYYQAKLLLLNAIAADAASRGNAAQTTANSAITILNAIASDNVLSKGEKPHAYLMWVAIYNEQAAISSAAATLGVSHSTFDTAYSALASYLTALSPAFGDYTQDTTIVGTTYSSKFTDYYNAKENLRNATDAAAATQALWTNIVNQTNAPANNATADLFLVNSSNITLNGNAATKTGATAGSWDAQVYSTAGYTGGAIAEARITGSGAGLMFGLNTDPTTDASYTSIDYAWYISSATAGRIYESNTAVGGGAGTIFATLAAGDTLAVVTDNVNVFYLQNGVVRRTVPISASGLKMHFDSSFADAGASLSNIRFGPMSSNDFSSIGGDTRPVNNATVGAADAATSMGFNPQFTAWPVASTYPTGWAGWVGTPAKESSTVRTPPYAVKWTVSGDTGMMASASFTTTPTAVGTYLKGTFDVNITSNNGGTCRPGYYIVLYTNAAKTTSVPVIVPAAAGQLGWQRVPFKAQVGATQQIYGFDIYQMASWSSMTGGASTTGSVCIFDNLTFDTVLQLTDAETNTPIPSISGLSNMNLLSRTNGTDISYGTKTATPVNMTAPYSYAWTIVKEYGDNLYLTNSTTDTPTFWGSGTNKYVMGQATCVVTDAKGRTAIGYVYVNNQHGTGIPP